jgi:hypothetical protein
MFDKILESEVAKFVLGLDKNITDERVKEFSDFVTRDYETYVEFIMFIDLFKRSCERFTITQNYHKRVFDEKGKYYDIFFKLINDTKEQSKDNDIRNILYNLLRPESQLLYKEYIETKEDQIQELT